MNPYYIMMEKNKISEKIFEVMTYCYLNKIEFTYSTDGDVNFFIKNENNLILNISDKDDKNLYNLITEEFNKLKTD